MIPCKTRWSEGGVPAVKCRCLCCIKRLVDAVIIEFLLPGCKLVSPSLSLLAGQIRAQYRFCPGGSQVTEKTAGLAIRVVQVFPLAHIFFRDPLKDRERLAPIVCLNQRPGFIDELSNLINHGANMPVRLGRTHTVQAVNAGSHLAAYCLRIYSNSGLWRSLLWRSCWLRC